MGGTWFNSHPRYRLGDSDGTPGHLGMQPLHHLPVELDRAARGVFRPLECSDDPAGLGDFLLRRREDDIAVLDLARMDQGLAVEAKIARLRAFLPKAVDVGEIAVGAIENFEAMGASGENG